MIILGITGRAGAGKNTVCDFIVRHTSDFVHEHAFAKPLKAGLRAAFGLSLEQTDGAEKENPLLHLGGKTPRQLMQLFGTEFARNMVDPNIWINMTELYLLNLKNATNGHGKVIITDVRFDNEAELIRKHGGQILCVHRPGETVAPYHVSEQGVSPDLIDFHIYNQSMEYLEGYCSTLADRFFNNEVSYA